jgi:hypothetical protein
MAHAVNVCKMGLHRAFVRQQQSAPGATMDKRKVGLQVRLR